MAFHLSQQPNPGTAVLRTIFLISIYVGKRDRWPYQTGFLEYFVILDGSTVLVMIELKRYWRSGIQKSKVIHLNNI